MKLGLLLLFVGLAAAAEEAELTQDNGVYVLTEKNFEAFQEAHPTSLIEFYAPWCGHCKALTPEFEKAAKALAGKTPPVPLAKVDATVEAELGKQFDVSGYPTLKFFKDGEKSDYDGPREADGIVDWIVQKTDPNYKPPPSDVVVLGAANFDDVVKAADIALVEFYAPWCGHCKKLAPEYEIAARKLKASGIVLGNVDATVEADLGKEYGVSGYPTLKIFRKGKVFDYNGPREAAGIVSHMLEQSAPAAKALSSAAELKRFKSLDDITIVGFFDSKDGRDFEAFNDFAEAGREDYKFVGYSTDAGVAKASGAKAGDILVFQPERFHSNFEPKFKKLSKANPTREDISAFVGDNVLPLVGHRTKPATKRYTKRPLVVVYYGVDFSHAHKEGTQYWRSKVLKVAADKKFAAFTFAISDENEFADELKSFGLDDSGQDVNVAALGKDGKKYPWNPDEFDDFSEDVLREFMDKLNTGKIKPFIKSQSVPKTDGPVKTLVASNFDKVVNDATKGVLIEFYAPWCGHCKQLDPIYKELAQKHKANADVVIAKFDATANDVPENFKVEGFPTLFWVPAGQSREPQPYSGGRTLKDLDEFITKNTGAAKEEL